MIVDDEKGIRDLFSDALTRKGYSVVSVGSGGDAMSRLDAGGIKLVFLDIRMSGVNGVRVLEYLTEKHPDVRAVMITGFASMEMEQRVMDLKPFAVLRKPFGIKDILSVASEALSTT